MTMSLYIARLIGPLLLVNGAAILLAGKCYCTLAQEFLASRAMMLLSGFVTLFIGLGIVNTHNLWRPGWPLLITLLGWLFVAGGTLRMAFPNTVRRMGTALLRRPRFITGSAIAELLLGLGLSFAGYASCSQAYAPWQSLG